MRGEAKVVYPHKGTLWDNKEERRTDPRHDVAEPGAPRAEGGQTQGLPGVRSRFYEMARAGRSPDREPMSQCGLGGGMGRDCQWG